MSEGKFMRTYRNFLELVGVPKRWLKVSSTITFVVISHHMVSFCVFTPRKHSRSVIRSKLSKGEIVGKPDLDQA